MKDDIRVYPECCQSMSCSKLSESCPGCVNKKELDAFENWKTKHKAIVTSPIWNPAVYTATC